MAGVQRVELCLTRLELAVLPVHYTPIYFDPGQGFEPRQTVPKTVALPLCEPGKLTLYL